MASYLDYTSLQEERNTRFTAEEVVTQLMADFHALHRDSKEILAEAENADDIATVDLMAKQTDWLEETIWMLKASLG